MLGVSNGKTVLSAQEGGFIFETRNAIIENRVNTLVSNSQLDRQVIVWYQEKVDECTPAHESSREDDENVGMSQ
jgi:hypothetical protein